MAEDTMRLPGDPKGAVLRFAPNPNGTLTIGHARGVVTNHYLATKYSGRFILRFDDTDPRTKKPVKEAYQWIQDDCQWLGCVPDEVVTASLNIDAYYQYAVRLIGDGHAYVCTCEREAFKTKKDQMIACPCRELAPEEHMRRWNAMFKDYKEGEAALRIKTDIKHPDPALRDWVAFRIIEDEHPLVGRKYRVWPMLDFESAIEDHVRGVTHIIRGIDLMDSGLKQKYVYDYLGWNYPEVILWGRIQLDETGKFSTSKMAADIASGLFRGWDDHRLPTLRGLRRRGIQPEAVRQFMLSLGLSDSAAGVSMDTLYALNRSLLDEKTDRYFFIPDPVALTVEDMPGKTVRMPLHPTHKGRGVREQSIREGAPLYICRADSTLSAGEVVKLMGLACIEVKSVGDGRVTASHCRGEHKKARKIQCLQDYVACEVLKPDGSVDRGYCEPQAAGLQVGAIIQFERYGFCRLDSKEGGKLVFCFGHK